MKITEEELETLEVWDITFYTEDKDGNTKFWKTTHHVDHSFICDAIEVDDLYYKKKENV